MSARGDAAAELAFLKRNAPAMADDLRRFVERESPSDDRTLLAGFAEFLAAEAEKAGGRAETVEGEDGSRHLRITWGPETGGRGEHPLLIGHFDTVWPRGTLERMPFRIEDGRAYGPGSFDMKAGIIQGLWAMRALHDVSGYDGRVVFLCTSDEEIGSHGSRALIEREASEARCVFVLEPSHHGALKTARKGVGQFRVLAEGRASHAGLAPEEGISAIDELARAILQLRDLQDLAAGSTVNVGVIAGGTRSNVVAAEARAEVDVRFFTQREADRLAQEIRGLTPYTEGARLTVEGEINRPPLERTARVAALFQTAREISAGLGFTLEEVAVGGASDGNFCAAMGVPVLDGLGAVGDGAHAIDEHVSLEDMPSRAALLAGLVRASARGGERTD